MEYVLRYGHREIVIEADCLREAMALAEDEVCYNQADLDLYDADGQRLLAQRHWWGCLDGLEDNEDPIRFGSYGYYGDWVMF